MKKRVLIDISSHGFGHVSQTAPVINALLGSFPDLELTVRSGVPERLLQSRIGYSFELVPESSDFGIRMKNAIDVDAAATAASYAAFHADWESRVASESAWLKAASFDLVLANVSYLPLKAASLAGIPAVALCSLNWADLYRHYCLGFPGSEAVHREILEAYSSATAFLKIEPSMPMTDLGGIARQVGPIAEVGRNRAAQIRDRLGLKPGERIGLVSMGGMPYSIPFGKWPRFKAMHLLVPERVARPDMTCFESLGMPFGDLIASCDAMAMKPGYGSFVEAAASGVAVLYVSRGDWPEQPFLVDWLKSHARCLEVGRELLEKGEIAGALDGLLAMPEKSKPAATGAAQAADFLKSLLT